MEGALSVPQTRIGVLDTRDPDELTQMLSRLVGRARVGLLGRRTTFHGRISHVSLGDIRIIHGKYTTGFKLHLPDFNTFVGSPAPLKGTGTHEIGGKDVTVSKGRGAVLSPGGAVLQFGPDFEHLSMAFRPAALMGKLSAIVGDLHLGPLRFDPAVNANNPQSQTLKRLVGFVNAEFESSSSLMPPILLSELLQSMMTSFLMANANNYSGHLHGEPLAAAPWQVRRAEQFIEANWNQPITIEALVAATDVSARSLYYSFKAGRGYSPMDFVKRVRLGRARQKLSRPDAETSVTAVAFECGFGNPGHFAKDYRDRFGERPSETLRRGRVGY
jgi:AraC-like DNA-binding protein